MTTLSAQHDQLAEAPPTSARPEVCALVIEARPGTASELRSLLGAASAARFSVLRTATVAAGIDALELGGVDAVVLGSEIPLDAPTTAPLLRAAGAAVPVVALVGGSDPEEVARALEIGLHDCVPVGGLTPDTVGSPLLRAVQRARAAAGRAPVPPPTIDAPPAPLRTVSPRALQAATPAVEALVGLLELLTTAWEVLTDEQKLGLVRTVGSCAATVEQLTTVAAAAIDAPPEPQLIALAPAVLDAARRVDDVEIDLSVDADTAVWADPNHLREILVGLLTHALGSTAPPLTVTATNGGATVRVSVTGHGALPRTAASGFSLLHPTSAAFEDADSPGLETARRLAEDSGGIAGVDEHQGAVWARLPNLPRHPDLT